MGRQPRQTHHARDHTEGARSLGRRRPRRPLRLQPPREGHPPPQAHSHRWRLLPGAQRTRPQLGPPPFSLGRGMDDAHGAGRRLPQRRDRASHTPLPSSPLLGLGARHSPLCGAPRAPRQGRPHRAPPLAGSRIDQTLMQLGCTQAPEDDEFCTHCGSFRLGLDSASAVTRSRMGATPHRRGRPRLHPGGGRIRAETHMHRPQRRRRAHSDAPLTSVTRRPPPWPCHRQVDRPCLCLQVWGLSPPR